MKKGIKISEYCRKIRISTGLSANAFAKTKDISHTYITNVESGKVDKPSVAKLIKLVNVYDLSKEDLHKLDIDPYFLGELENYSFFQKPITSFLENAFSRQLTNLIELELKPMGYRITDTPGLDNKQSKRGILKIDKKWDIVPLYDAKGFNPEGKECYIYILTSAIRQMIDSEYNLFIAKQMGDVETSIKYSPKKGKKKDIELLFATSSSRAYKLAEQLIDNNIYDSSIETKILFYENRRGKK